MKIPKEVKIGPYLYKVELVKHLKEGKNDMFGLCNFGELKISLRTKSVYNKKIDIAPLVLEATFIHEVLEAINYHYELRLKHSNISSLETILIDVFKDCGIIT